MKKQLELLGLVLAAWTGVVVLVPPPAWAIPAFARRYGMSCSACHDAWPHLNPAGESFMMSGYRRLNGQELKPTAEDVKLALEALTLPAIPPLAVMGQAGFDFQGVKREAADGSTATRKGNSFNLNEIELLAGAPLGKHLSFFLDYELFETEIERPTGPGEANETDTRKDITFETEGPRAPGMAMLIWNSLLPESMGPLDSLNVIGGINELPLAFSPEHRRLSASPYLIYLRRGLDFLSGTPVDDLLTEDENRRLFRLSEPQIGVELNGKLTPGGRPGTTAPTVVMLDYHLGVTNGSNKDSDPNTAKDIFGRLAVRWWGQTLGIFGYWSPDIYSDSLRTNHSIATGGIFSGAKRSNKTSSIGPDLTLRLDPWDIPLWIETQVLFNRESNPTGFDKSFNWWGGFTQLNWKILKPLVAYGRYDWLRGDRFDDTDGGGVTGPVRPREWAATVGLQWYLLENMKVIGEYGHREFKNTASTPSQEKVKEDVFTIRVAAGF